MTFAALLDVHTMPSCSPQKALMAAVELMYVTGTTSVTPSCRSSSQRHLELIDRRHVGHRAPGRQIRQEHGLVRRAEHVRALGHEVDAAEDDEVRVTAGRGVLRELQRVAGVVGEPDHLVALVVMPEDHEPIAECRFGGGDAQLHLLVRQPQIALGQRLAVGEAGLFVSGEKVQIHGACEKNHNVQIRKWPSSVGPCDPRLSPVRKLDCRQCNRSRRFGARLNLIDALQVLY